MSSLPPGTDEAFDRLRNFILVNGHKAAEEGVPALIAFGKFIGLDDEGQLKVFRLVESCGFNPREAVSTGVYVGFLVGVLAGQEAALNSASGA